MWENVISSVFLNEFYCVNQLPGVAVLFCLLKSNTQNVSLYLNFCSSFQRLQKV
jgi:hypothetical protein